MSVKTILILLCISSIMYAQEVAVDRDYDAIVKQEIAWHSQKADSVFVHYQFENKHLFQWFNFNGDTMFDRRAWLSDEDKKQFIAMAKQNDAQASYPSGGYISSALSDMTNVYFIDINTETGITKSIDGKQTVSKQHFIDKKRYKTLLSEPYFSDDNNYAVIFSHMKTTIGYVLYKKEKGVWKRLGYITCSIV